MSTVVCELCGDTKRSGGGRGKVLDSDMDLRNQKISKCHWSGCLKKNEVASAPKAQIRREEFSETCRAKEIHSIMPPEYRLQ